VELGFTSIAAQDFGEDGLNFFIDLGQDFLLAEQEQNHAIRACQSEL